MFIFILLSAVFVVYKLNENEFSEKIISFSNDEISNEIKEEEIDDKNTYPLFYIQDTSLIETCKEDSMVVVDTSEGIFFIKLQPEWAPLGVERFVELLRDNFYTDAAIFRVLPEFVSQFGLAADPQANDKYKQIMDDPSLPDVGNKKGRLSFATSGANTRSTQVFINTASWNKHLDATFPPFGEIFFGMDIVESFYSKYREDISQRELKRQGIDYINKNFPLVSRIKSIVCYPFPGVYKFKNLG